MTMKDRNNTTHAYVYDAIGRVTTDTAGFGGGSVVDQARRDARPLARVRESCN